jgi:hypothetical protein
MLLEVKVMCYIADICTAVAELVNSVFPRVISMVASLTFRDTIRTLHISGKHH